MATLALCMIVKDEEKNIGNCLKSLKEAVDEIIVVDTGSTDKTVEIAKGFGAKVFPFLWQDDFAAARNEAIKHATSDYIIWLDADERLNKSDLKKLLKLKNELPQEKNIAYAVEILNYRKGRLPEAAYQTRIFPNLKGIKFKGNIHEQISFSLAERGIKFEISEIKIRHLGYFTLEMWKNKIKRNLSFLKQALSHRNEEDNWDIHFYLGMSYLNLEEYTLAQQHFLQALTEECRHKNPYFYLTAGIELAKLLENEKNYSQALQILLKLKEEFPTNALVLYTLGKYLYGQNEYEAALAYFKQCSPHDISLGIIPISKKDYIFDYYWHLGLCYEGINHIAQAIEAFQRALQVKPLAIKLIAHLSSLLLFKTARTEEAIHYLIKGIHLMEKHGIPKANQEVYIALCLMLAIVFAKQCRIEECVFLAERLLKSMHLPSQRTLYGLTDLVDIYQEIGEVLRYNSPVWANLAFDTAKQLQDLPEQVSA